MSRLQELLAQRDAIDAEIAQLQSESRKEGLAKIKELMASHGITADDLTSGTRSKASVGGKSTEERVKAPIKYSDPATGEKWTGRGLMPVWLRTKVEAGAKKEDFLVA